MAELDTSMYPKAQNTSPLALPLQMQQLQQGQLQNAQMAQQMQARQALGPILQQSIGSDGKLDYNKAFQLMSMEPKTAFMAPDFLNAAVQRQQVQADTALKEFSLRQNTLDQISKTAMQLVAEGKSGDRGTIIQRAADLHIAGLMPKEQFLNFVQQLPATPGVKSGESDPALDKYIKAVGIRTGSLAEQHAALYPALQQVKGNNGTTVVQSPGMFNDTRQVGSVADGVTPDAANALGKTIGNNGAVMDVPRFQQGPMIGGTQPTFQSGPGGAATPVGPEPGQLTPPTTAPAPQLPNGPTAPGTPGVKYANTSSLDEDRKKALDEFGSYGADLSKVASAADNSLRLVQEGRSLIDNGMKTGPGRETWLRLGEMAKAAGADDAMVKKINGGPIGDSQAFESTMLQLATAQMKQALEGGSKFTNLEFKAFTDAKPNLAKDPEGVKKMFQILEDQAKMVQAHNAAYNAYVKQTTATGEPRSLPDFRENVWQPRYNHILNGIAQRDQANGR